MQYQIIGQTVPAVECTLMCGESMFTQAGGTQSGGMISFEFRFFRKRIKKSMLTQLGGMIWETEGISMQTNARDGNAKGLGWLFSGESIFTTNYTAEQDNVRIAFGSTVPGSVIPVDVGTTPLIVQEGAFLCAEQSVQLDITLSKELSAGFFGGEGFALHKLSGTGMAFLAVAGDTVQYDLRAGEVLKVNNGNVVAYDPNVQYDIETVKGLGNILLGGEGLFLTRLTGPGRVILQTQNFNDFARRITARIPKSN